MSLCQKCLKDSKKHTEKQWVTHQEELKKVNNVKCNLCHKKKGDHSESLLEIHESVILKAMLKTRHKKLWVIQQGLGTRCPALLDDGTHNLLGAIRTSMSTLGVKNIKEMQNVEIVIAPSLLTEGKVYQKAQQLGMGK